MSPNSGHMAHLQGENAPHVPESRTHGAADEAGAAEAGRKAAADEAGAAEARRGLGQLRLFQQGLEQLRLSSRGGV